MIDFTTTQCLLFPEIFAKPAVLQFDQRQAPSDYSHGAQTCSHRVSPVEYKGGLQRDCLSQVRRRNHPARPISASQASRPTRISDHPRRERLMFLGTRHVTISLEH